MEIGPGARVHAGLVSCPVDVMCSRAEITLGCFWDAECEECTDNCNLKLLIALARE